MRVKASAAYDQAGLKTTKSLVSRVRQIFGRTVPDSLRGEPISLNPRSPSFENVRRGDSPKKKAAKKRR